MGLKNHDRLMNWDPVLVLKEKEKKSWYHIFYTLATHTHFYMLTSLSLVEHKNICCCYGFPWSFSFHSQSTIWMNMLGFSTTVSLATADALTMCVTVVIVAKLILPTKLICNLICFLFIIIIKTGTIRLRVHQQLQGLCCCVFCGRLHFPK